MSRRILAIIIFALVLTPTMASAAFPSPTGFVNDFAGVISASTRANLESMLGSFERASGNEIAVATIPSLDGGSVEDVAVRLYQQWGIGKKGQDNGALFLVVPSDRKARIEVGYGLEGVINDALAGRILDEYAIPHFKQGEMDEGIAAGTLALVKNIATKEGIAFDADSAYGADTTHFTVNMEHKSGVKLSVPVKIIVLLILIYLFIRHPWLFLLFLSGVGRGGGGFGGGFGGFGGGLSGGGGGLSGGGGASRGW